MNKLTDHLTLVLALILFIVSCNNSPNMPDGDSESEEEQLIDIYISDMTIVENTRNVLSVYVSYTSSEPTYSLLQINCGDYLNETLSDMSRLKTEHEFFVMGLVAETECTFTAHSSSIADYDNPSAKKYTVSNLPEYLAHLTVNTELNDKIQPGWILSNLSDNCGIYPSTECETANSNDFSKKPLILAMYDEQGRYRWYYRSSAYGPGGGIDVRSTDDGILFGGEGAYPTMLDWEGKTLWTKQWNIHHHFEPIGNEQYIALTFEGGCPEEFGEVQSDTIHIWDRSLDEDVFSWQFCEHYTPDNIRPDWSHMNTATPFQNENALLFSSRSQYTIYKLDLDTKEISWKLGLNGDFEMIGDVQFFRQHDPQFLENGNILLFDNGEERYRPYSRALEIKYNTETMTAEKVWSYRAEPDIFADIFGDADRLPNGNTLIVFGREEALKPSHIIEVSNEGEKVLEIITPPMWSIYRAEKIYDPVAGFAKN